MEEEKQTYNGHNANYKAKRKIPSPSKVSDQKVYNYIKKIEIDGLPRVRAYAEAIDKHIYDMPPQQIAKRLDYFKSHCSSYNDIRQMVLAEQQEWSLRRSAAVQDKAMNLLTNLLDKANEIATNPDADAKQLSQAVSMLKTIMPAFTAVGGRRDDSGDTNRKARAEKFIN